MRNELRCGHCDRPVTKRTAHQTVRGLACGHCYDRLPTWARKPRRLARTAS